MLDDHDVVAAVLLRDEGGGVPLGMECVQGDDHARQVESLEGGPQLGDLIRLGPDLPLRDGAALSHVEGRQQVGPGAVRADDTAHRLAVRGGLRQQPGNGRPACLARRPALLPLAPGGLRQPARADLGHGVQVAVTASFTAALSALMRTRRNVRSHGGLTCPVHRSRRPPRTRSASWEQPAAQSAIADGESCPAAVNAHTARARTNSSGCQRPIGLRGSGTRASHSRRRGRAGPSAARTADSSSRGTSIREDSSAGTIFSGGTGRVVPLILGNRARLSNRAPHPKTGNQPFPHPYCITRAGTSTLPGPW
jgi:hypothetical protein